MNEIESVYSKSEMNRLKQYAESKGMTVEEFQKFATQKIIDEMTEHARKKMQIKPSLRVVK